ncbi:L-alanine dehydrogenase [Halogeometricum rufum]|uniref:Alanine dehydrogenase n=1 Tax=Halogeometricum rufum TaxID=553469 RepID=A0A1I6IQ50_9EURY|nr:ornithine cyclodeaminase family protein [Halogeometricum rufum]SFR68749.1 L-alanine dehydrogenase [Halogeometricum rufum]
MSTTDDTTERSTTRTTIVSSRDVEAHLDMGDLVPAVEAAFAAYENGTAQMPPKSYVDLPQYDGDFRSMPAYLETDDWQAAGIKWVNVHPDNPSQFDLPTVMGTLVYTDPRSGFPLAVMDATTLTMKRTGAAAAVATDHLAVPDASTLGIVGAGVQSYSQLEAIAEVRPIDTVVVSDPDDDRLARFVEAFENDFDVRTGTVAEAASCDVLSTVTPVESPIVSVDDLGDHTHVNAMGADAEGKQELQTEVVREATLVIDDFEQTTHSGEINVPWRTERLDRRDIDAELGEVVDHDPFGGDVRAGVTVFDSTGLAIQDLAAARVVYHSLDDAGSDLELVATGR